MHDPSGHGSCPGAQVTRPAGKGTVPRGDATTVGSSPRVARPRSLTWAERLVRASRAVLCAIADSGQGQAEAVGALEAAGGADAVPLVTEVPAVVVPVAAVRVGHAAPCCAAELPGAAGRAAACGDSGQTPTMGQRTPPRGQGRWGTLTTGHGNTRSHPQGAGAAHLPHLSRRRSRSPAPRRRHVPGGCSGRWRSGTPGGRRQVGGIHARLSRRRSRARRRSGRPRARTAPWRSGAGGGRSVGRRLHPSRPRSRPRCRRARLLAHSARWCGRGTPSRGSGAGAGRAGRWARIATARPRTCCGVAGAQSWCVVPACLLCTRCCRGGTRDGDTPPAPHSPVLAALLHPGAGWEGDALPDTRALGGVDAAALCPQTERCW